MHALVYGGAGHKEWTTVPDPSVVDPTDAIIRIDAATICGTDLHILKGDVPEVTEGRVLGHEAVGTVVATGSAVSTVQPGDRVLASCISACGRCRYCRQASYGQCLGGGGWILGHLVHGVQAEYARIPFADTSLYALPDTVSNEQAVMLADILPTSYEVGVLGGHVGPGDTVVIVGAGPIGLAAIITAQLFSPSHVLVIDPAAGRREAAHKLGAMAIDPAADDPVEVVRAMTGGLGADAAMEAVGIPETFELCTQLVRPGRQYRRPRAAGDPAPGNPVDPQRDHHDGPGGHGHHAHAAAPAGQRAARRVVVPHPPLPAGGHPAGVRRVRRPRPVGCAEGPPHRLTGDPSEAKVWRLNLVRDLWLYSTRRRPGEPGSATYVAQWRKDPDEGPGRVRVDVGEHRADSRSDRRRPA